MKFLRRGNLFLIHALSAMLMLFAFVPVFAGESDQYVKDIDGVMQAMARDLQKKTAAQLQLAMDTEIVLSYENILAQQISANTEQIALAASIEPNPFLSMEPKEMLAKAVPVEKAAPVEDEEDCVRIQ